MNNRAQATRPPGPATIGLIAAVVGFYVGFETSIWFAAGLGIAGFVAGFSALIVVAALEAVGVYLMGGTVKLNGKEYSREK